jgi:hypothetical protein
MQRSRCSTDMGILTPYKLPVVLDVTSNMSLIFVCDLIILGFCIDPLADQIHVHGGYLSYD